MIVTVICVTRGVAMALLSRERYSRHSKAMHLLQAGVNLVYIRDLLGYSDIKTTEIYAWVDLDSKKAALEMAYPSTSRTPYPAWGQDGELLSWLQSLGKDDRPAG